MKNFKVIISLLALLTASDALPMTGTERRAARRAQAANAATTQDLTQVTPVEVAPTTTTGRRRDRAQVATPVTQVTPVQAAAPTGRRRDRGQVATPVTQVTPVQAAAPTTTTGRRRDRRAGAQAEPVQVQAPVQVEQEPVGTRWDVPGGVGSLPEGASQETIYFKVADIFYDQDKKTLKPAGIKKYLEMVQTAYPDLKGQDLINKTYEDAVKILIVAKRENPNATSVPFKNLCNQLKTMIETATTHEKLGSYKPAVRPQPAAQRKSSIFQGMEVTPSGQEFNDEGYMKLAD